jgi:hypothetical protein
MRRRAAMTDIRRDARMMGFAAAARRFVSIATTACRPRPARLIAAVPMRAALFRRRRRFGPRSAGG